MLSRNVNLIGHNSYRVQAVAEQFLFPATESDLFRCLSYIDAHSSGVIIGSGSNIILSQWRYAQPVLVLAGFNRFVEIDGEYVVAGAGAPLAAVVELAAQNGLWGIEKLVGVPGTVGGAIHMNAGAYCQDIGSCVEWVESIGINDGAVRRYSPCELNFRYRYSVFKEKSEIISTVKLRLTLGDEGASAAIRSVSLSTLKTRLAKIPYHLPNAGSVFKRPDGEMSVGEMVDKLGLKGISINGAMVAHLHAGIIVNTGFATGSDIFQLAAYLKSAVYEEFGIRLEMEQVLL